MIIFELLEIKNSYVWNENCISMDGLIGVADFNSVKGKRREVQLLLFFSGD